MELQKALSEARLKDLLAGQEAAAPTAANDQQEALQPTMVPAQSNQRGEDDEQPLLGYDGSDDE